MGQIRPHTEFCIKVAKNSYAVACDVAAADGYTTQKGLRLLELWRELLKIGRLNVAAIVRSAHARHMTLMITS
jgi:hypothetical protein